MAKFVFFFQYSKKYAKISTMKSEKANIAAKRVEPDHLHIDLSGRLDLYSVPDLWRSSLDLLDKYSPKTLTIEAKKIDYCDSAGIALLLELKKYQQAYHN